MPSASGENAAPGTSTVSGSAMRGEPGALQVAASHSTTKVLMRSEWR